MNIIEKLVNIGPRLAGSKNENKAALVIKDMFTDIGMYTHIQNSNYIGWCIEESPKLELFFPNHIKIPVEALTYSGPIKVDKMTVNIEKSVSVELSRGVPAEAYSLISTKNKFEIARIYVRDIGPEVAFNSKRPRSLLAEMVAGEDYKKFFIDLIKQKNIVLSLSLKTNLNTKAVTKNVIASYNNIEDMNEIIIVGAHYDTVYCSPGANDNASGIYAIQSIASKLKSVSKNVGLLFVAYGAEEIGLFGSKLFFDWMKYSNYLPKIKAIVNLDMVGAGDPNWFNVTDDEVNFKKIIETLLSKNGFVEKYGKPIFEIPPWMTSDHAEFTKNGIPTLFISYKGNKYPYIHTPEDTLDKIDFGKINFAINTVSKTIQYLTKNN